MTYLTWLRFLFSILLCSLICADLWAQLSPISVEETTGPSYVNRRTVPGETGREAFIVIQTNIPGLTVESTLGLISSEWDGSELRLKVASSRQRLTFKAAGHTNATTTIDPSQKETLHFEVMGLASQTISRLRVQFDVSPLTAEVTVDGISFGRERQFDLTLGAHEVSISAPGFLTQRAQIDVSSDQVNTFAFRLDPVPLYPLTITSRPQGASVRIQTAEGTLTGTTPLIAELPEGEYQVELFASGFQDERRVVRVRPSTRGNTEDVELRSSQGRLVVNVDPSDALIEIDGVRRRGTTFDLNPRLYELRVSADGYKPYLAVINVEAAQNSDVEITLERLTGTLQFTVFPPDAEVELYSGRQSIQKWMGNQRIELPLGSYELRVEAPDFEDERIDIEIVEDQITRATATLLGLESKPVAQVRRRGLRIGLSAILIGSAAAYVVVSGDGKTKLPSPPLRP